MSAPGERIYKDNSGPGLGKLLPVVGVRCPHVCQDVRMSGVQMSGCQDVRAEDGLSPCCRGMVEDTRTVCSLSGASSSLAADPHLAPPPLAVHSFSGEHIVRLIT